MTPRFFWDERKAEANRIKHGVRFEDATGIFADPLQLSTADVAHSGDEDRFVAVGSTGSGEILVVNYTIRDDEVRIISARRATRTERRRYMDNDRIHDADEMAEEYDFSNGVRGRHVFLSRDAVMVVLDPDVAAHFRDTETVNAALRVWIAEGRAVPRA